MHLNPHKCTFRASIGKFVCYMLSKRGIELNAHKSRTILKMQMSKVVKDIRKLNARLVTLTRFAAKSAKRTLPFFWLLKEDLWFQWT